MRKKQIYEAIKTTHESKQRRKSRIQSVVIFSLLSFFIIVTYIALYFNCFKAEKEIIWEKLAFLSKIEYNKNRTKNSMKESVYEPKGQL